MIKVAIEEAKDARVYEFGLSVVDSKKESLVWKEKVVTARKEKTGWTVSMNIDKKAMGIDWLEEYRKLLDTVSRVIETEGMNLSGMKVENKKGKKEE
jgi:hypothetical protein